MRASNEEIRRRYPIVMERGARFDPVAVRAELLHRGSPNNSAFVRYAYRPFDNRWLYWEDTTKLLDEKRADYRSQIYSDNLWLCSSHRIRKGEAHTQSIFTRSIASYHLLERVASWFPAYLCDDSFANPRPFRYANLSSLAQSYLEQAGLGVDVLFHHVLAVLNTPSYLSENANALRTGWPRIPLPGWTHGEVSDAADILTQSATRGRELARLLDPDTPVPGVTQGELRPGLSAMAVPTVTHGRNMGTS